MKETKPHKLVTKSKLDQGTCKLNYEKHLEEKRLLDSNLLPSKMEIPDVRVHSNEYLKIYKFLNPLHDINHEGANSLLNNISMDNRHELNKNHPHFNHT